MAAALGLALASPALSTQIHVRDISSNSSSKLYASAEERRRRTIEILRARIEKFAQRSVNWDGMDGRAPSTEAREHALAFLDMLPAGFMPSQTFAPGDGEVLFQWEKGSSFIEVGFYGDSTISWYIRGPDGDSQFGDDHFDGTVVTVPIELKTELKI